MVDKTRRELADAAEAIYATRLRPQLEPEHNGEFVAIEPVSGEYFLGKTLSEAIQAARRSFPDRYPYAMRVGIHPAIHLGSCGW